MAASWLSARAGLVRLKSGPRLSRSWPKSGMPGCPSQSRPSWLRLGLSSVTTSALNGRGSWSARAGALSWEERPRPSSADAPAVRSATLAADAGLPKTPAPARLPPGPRSANPVSTTASSEPNQDFVSHPPRSTSPGGRRCSKDSSSSCVRPSGRIGNPSYGINRSLKDYWPSSLARRAQLQLRSPTRYRGRLSCAQLMWGRPNRPTTSAASSRPAPRPTRQSRWVLLLGTPSRLSPSLLISGPSSDLDQEFLAPLRFFFWQRPERAVIMAGNGSAHLQGWFQVTDGAVQ